MALISCPECGKEISDKVKACPHCGYPLLEESQTEAPQKVEVTSVKLGPKDPVKTKKAAIFLTVAIVIIAGIAAAAFGLKKHNEAVARAEYISNLSLARTTMLSGGADAEGLCNLTKSVWYNTIYKKSDSTTNQYTQTNGRFNDDFNKSLKALYLDADTLKIIDEIEQNQVSVAAIMKELQNPPEDLYTCYTTIDAMYEIYQSFTKLAVSPSGNLQTFSENFNAYDNDFMMYYQKLETQIPDE